MKPWLGYPPVLWALALFFMGLGFATRVDVPLAIFAATAVIALGNQPQRPARAYLEHLPIILFVAVALIATFFSRDVRQSLGVQPQFLPALLCYVVICQFADTVSKQRFIGLALAASGALTACLMIAASGVEFVGEEPLRQVRLLNNALLIVPNDVLMLAVIAPLAVGACWGASLGWRLLVVVYLVLAMTASVMVQSRQSVLLLLVGVVAVVTMMQPRWSLPVLFGGFILGVLIDGMQGWPMAHRIFMFPRVYVWHTAWSMFLDRPWIGQGPGTFNDLYFRFLEKSGYVLAELGDRRTMPWAHSLYLEQLAERGIPGLLVLLLVLGSALQRAGKACVQAATIQIRSQAAGVLGSLLVLVAAGIAEATLTRLWVSVVLLVLVGLAQVLRATDTTSAVLEGH